jgi:hypothetical protein
MTAIAEDARVYRWREKKEGARTCLEREISKDKGGTASNAQRAISARALFRMRVYAQARIDETDDSAGW